METQNLFIITNQCTCTIFNEVTQEWDESPQCYSDCWYDQLYMVEDATRHLFDINDAADHAGWMIEGFPTWSGTVSGTFDANQPEELINAITPSRTEWRLQFEVSETELTGILYHHDAPTGGRIRVFPKGELALDPCTICDNVAPLDGLGVCNSCNFCDDCTEYRDECKCEGGK